MDKVVNVVCIAWSIEAVLGEERWGGRLGLWGICMALAMAMAGLVEVMGVHTLRT